MTARIKCFFCCIDRHILEFLTHICLGFAWVNQHLYRTKTSSLQIISGLSLIFFGLAFGVGGDDLYSPGFIGREWIETTSRIDFICALPEFSRLYWSGVD